MAKRGRPKKVVKEENSILKLIKKLIGTAKRKTFWDWLTSKQLWGVFDYFNFN